MSIDPELSELTELADCHTYTERRRRTLELTPAMSAAAVSIIDAKRRQAEYWRTWHDDTHPALAAARRAEQAAWSQWRVAAVAWPVDFGQDWRADLATLELLISAVWDSETIRAEFAAAAVTVHTAI
jgi:hypothetical protein